MLRRSVKAWLTLALLVAAGAWLAGVGTRPLPDDLRAVMTTEPIALPPLQLVDHRGERVTESWFTGQWTLVTFGFTHCPDVCPATMAQLAVIRTLLLQEHAGVAPPRFVLISVDPKRDTPARLAGFVKAFDPTFIGISGAPAQIEAMAQPLEAFHRLGAPSAMGHYDVSHSGHIFLLDPAGRVYAKFEPPMEPARVARQLVSVMTYYIQETAYRSMPST